MSERVEPLGTQRARFGEGPVWDVARQVYWWVDITGGRLLGGGGRSGREHDIALGGEVAAVFPADDGSLLVARDSEILRVDPDRPARVEVVAGIPAHPRMRFNDGGVDPAGRLLIGTLHADQEPGTAALYRLHGTGLSPVLTGVTVSNGLGHSPDGRTLYYVDTPTLRIDRVDVDPVTGAMSARRPFADLSGSGGRPDGLTVDAEGHVWVALIFGGQLRRYSPDGVLDRIVELPVTHPTSVAFGGPDLAELVVSTALDPVPVPARQPLAGRLLRLDPGITGLPVAPVRSAGTPAGG